MAWQCTVCWLVLGILQPATVQSARFGGGRFGGIRSSGSRSSGGFSGGGRSSGGRYSSSGGYSRSRYNSGSYYSGNYGRSSSSGGFGLGLGGGLLLGYSVGRLSGPGYGYGYGYGNGYGGNSYGQRNRGSLDPSRPISCYSGSKAAKITEDVALEENLTRCDFQDDVCFGKVVLTVSNKTSSGNITSQGFLEVEKGCGKRIVFEARYKEKATFNSARQCFVTNIVKNSRVVSNYFTDNSSEPVLSDSTEKGTSTSTQEELCVCQGSHCNAGQILGVAMIEAWTVTLAMYWVRGWSGG